MTQPIAIRLATQGSEKSARPVQKANQDEQQAASGRFFFGLGVTAPLLVTHYRAIMMTAKIRPATFEECQAYCPAWVELGLVSWPYQGGYWMVTEGLIHSGMPGGHTATVGDIVMAIDKTELQCTTTGMPVLVHNGVVETYTGNQQFFGLVYLPKRYQKGDYIITK